MTDALEHRISSELARIESGQAPGLQLTGDSKDTSCNIDQACSVRKEHFKSIINQRPAPTPQEHIAPTSVLSSFGMEALATRHAEIGAEFSA